MRFQYYNSQDSEQFTFFRIPKQLFTDPAFKRISTEAKVLYGLLLDRMSLSKKSGWADKEDRVYIVFPLEEIKEQLGCCQEKAIKLLIELDTGNGIGLIERVRRGQGQPSIIYVKNFNAEEEEEIPEKPNSSLMSEKPTSRHRKNRLQEVGKTDLKISEKPTSRSKKSRPLEVGKTDPNKTYSIKTYNSDTDSIYPSIDLPEGGKMDGLLVHPQIERIRTSIRQQIEFDILAENGDTGLLTEIVNIMVKVMCSTSPMMRISGQDVPTELVKDAYRRLRPFDIEGVIWAYKAVEEPIQNPTGYMTSMLYNAPDSNTLTAINHLPRRF